MSHMPEAAKTCAAVVTAITPDQLTNPTPCTEYDVRALVNHMLFWVPALVGAGRKEIVDRSASSESDVDLTEGDWRTALLAGLDEIVAAWAPAAAWAGTTAMGGPDQMPAQMIGDMTAGELVLHGWDLARATGQPYAPDAGLLTHLHAALSETAELGREYGVFGPEVPVPATASPLDRLLGLTGRDPAWVGVSAGAAAPSAVC